MDSSAQAKFRELAHANAYTESRLCWPLTYVRNASQVLYKLLSSLSVPEEPEPNAVQRVKPGAAALAALEERGCTMLYRMPQWLYDDDE